MDFDCCISCKLTDFYFQGAIAGFFTSLIFTLWLGIGAQVYKPGAIKSNVSIADCGDSLWNATTTAMYQGTTVWDGITTLAPEPITMK